jgi:glyoxylase-like metal-dependent hydrolase (beta-lactamase superfamily II)
MAPPSKGASRVSSASLPIAVAILPVTPLQQNCTLVWCTKTNKAAVIDPGGEVDRILKTVRDNGLELEKIWVTHGHADHAGGVQALREATGLVVEGPHPDDRFWIERIPADSMKWGMGGAKDFEPDRWLHDGDTVQVGEAVFEVIHCPGHTPGHVIFFHRGARFAQVGDVLFKGSIGRTDFPRGNHDDLIAAITGKLWPLGGDVQFVPGHGPPSTFGQERASNPFVGDRALGTAD